MFKIFVAFLFINIEICGLNQWKMNFQIMVFFQDFEDNYIIHTSEQASHIIYTTYISGSPINRVSYSRVVFIHLNRILQEYILEEAKCPNICIF